MTKALCCSGNSSRGTLFLCALNLLQLFLPVMAYLCFVGLSAKLRSFWCFLAVRTHSNRNTVKLLISPLSTAEILLFTEIYAERFSGIVNYGNVEVTQKSRRWKVKQNNNNFSLSILVPSCKGYVFKNMFFKKNTCVHFFKLSALHLDWKLLLENKECWGSHLTVLERWIWEKNTIGLLWRVRVDSIDGFEYSYIAGL